MSDDEISAPSHDEPSLWKENHGNLLIGVFLGVVVLGGSVIAYQTNKFKKPRFPDGKSIQPPKDALAGDNDSVKIEVTGAANSNGSILVAIYDVASNFNDPSKAILKQANNIVDGTAELFLPLSELPENFAIAAFHDEDDNGVLNRHATGVPDRALWILQQRSQHVWTTNVCRRRDPQTRSITNDSNRYLG